MKRLLSILCALALMASVAVYVVLAADQDLQAAINASAGEIIVLEANASNLIITSDTYIDLNGYDIDGVEVQVGTLYCMDSMTDDFTVEDGMGYGQVSNAKGAVEAMPQRGEKNGYLKVEQDGKYSFHCVDLTIYAMTLRAADVGVYYKCNFAGDEVVASQVKSYGVALSVIETPCEENLDTYCGYSVFTDFEAGKTTNSCSTLLRDIMKAKNTQAINVRNASMPVYGSAYIETEDGYLFGGPAKRSFKEQVEKVDESWGKLTDTQKKTVVELYTQYADIIKNWEVPSVDWEVHSVEKFESAPNAQTTYKTGTTVAIGDLFAAVDGVSVDTENLQVTVEAVDGSSVVGTYTADAEDWTKGTLEFSGLGTVNVTINDGYYCVPVTATITIREPMTQEKFNGLVDNEIFKPGTTVALGKLFEAVEGVEVAIVPDSIKVIVTPAEGSTANADYSANSEDWTKSTLTFTGAGAATITITDEQFCIPTTIYVTVKDNDPVKKFNIKLPNTENYLYRVGNEGDVQLNSLFKAVEGAEIGEVSVTVEALDQAEVEGIYASKETWGNGTINFNGTGAVKVTITDHNYCIPTVLYLEVVEAKNVTVAEDATKNNVVLLNDIGSGFTVSGDYTFYGNGFTLTYTGDGRYLNSGLKHGIVTVKENGTLDNLRIKASIYPTAFMYYGITVMGDYVQQDSNPREVDGDRTRYYYQLSAVAASNDATISNCYIYGGRNNIFVDTGNVTIKDTVLECAPVANVQIQSTSEYTVTLENVTTIQYQVKPTIGNTNNVMLGAGVLVGPDTTSNPTIVLKGEFKQYNWVTEDDENAVSNKLVGAIIDGAVNTAAYNHTVNGKTSSNLGIIYMNRNAATVKNETELPYKLSNISMTYANNTVDGQVCSVQKASAAQIYSDYAAADRTTVNGDYMPTFDFNLGDQEISYDGNEDTRYLYGDENGVTALYLDGEAALTLDLSKIATIYKYAGSKYSYTAVCKNASGNVLDAPNNVVTLSAQGNYTLEFTVNDNLFYDQNGQMIEKSVERVFAVPLSLTVKEATIKNAEVKITKTTLDGVYKTVNLTDYQLQIKFLDCISVTDYDNKGNGTTVNLSSNISSATLTPSSVNVFTTASTITITYKDGRVLTVQLSKISGSSPGTKTAKVNTSGSVYFTTDGALDNKPTASGSQNKCTITSVSFKGNNGSTITNDTDVTVTWALGSSGGSCLAEGSMITMADGSKRAVETLRKGDVVMAYDHVTGEIVYREINIVGKSYADIFRKNIFVFDDGTELLAVNEHGVYDVDMRQYVNIDHLNYQQYIGHRFASVDPNGNIGVKKLVDVISTCESGYKYDIVTYGTLNYIVEDTLSASHEVVIIMNTFKFDDNMRYDAEQMQADIEKYGLYTYEEWQEHCEQSVFEKYNFAIMKVGVGKGLYTKEHIMYLLKEIALNDDVQITD